MPQKISEEGSKCTVDNSRHVKSTDFHSTETSIEATGKVSFCNRFKGMAIRQVHFHALGV